MANMTMTAYEEFVADLMSLDSLSLDLSSLYRNMISQAEAVVSSEEASDLIAPYRFSMVERDGLSDDVYNGAVYDTVSARFKEMRMIAQELPTLCSCDWTGFENDPDSAVPSDGAGSSISSSSSSDSESG
ncbi:unnamed protein product, partial [Ectocarpus sp. 12 AP-2014]